MPLCLSDFAWTVIEVNFYTVDILKTDLGKGGLMGASKRHNFRNLKVRRYRNLSCD